MRNYRKDAGLSLLDVVIGTALMLVIFVGIFGVMRLSIILVSTTKAAIGAVALANEQLEILRSLPYDDVGTIAGIPAGNIAQNATTTLNGIEYNRRVLIQYVDAEQDGLGVVDANGVTADYKVAKVEVTWDVRGNPHSFSLITNIVPKAIETLAGGGTLTVNVFDALGAPVTNAEVHVVNNTTTSTIDVISFTNTGGVVSFPGAPEASNYEVTVSKTGYSTAQTYTATTSNPNPNPGHLSVLAGDTTTASFAVDLLSTKTIRSFEPQRTTTFSDSFTNEALLATTTDTQAITGELELVDSGSGYGLATGTALSVDITSSYLISWNEFRFNDNVPPSTNVLYHMYYDNGGGPVLVPNGDLPGNSGGFGSSPVDLSGLSTTTYNTLIILAELRTADASTTPTVLDWDLEYEEGPIPLPDIPFTMQGEKTIGTDAGANPIYKFSEAMQTDGTGSVSTSTLEWDNYTITVNGATGYDIASICEPQPRTILPDTAVTTDMILIPDTPHTLLVTVQDDVGMLLNGASVRLHRAAGFDETKTTSGCGQVFFDNVPEGTISGGNAYDMDVSFPGYIDDNQTNIEVSGVSNAESTLFP